MFVCARQDCHVMGGAWVVVSGAGWVWGVPWCLALVQCAAMWGVLPGWWPAFGACPGISWAAGALQPAAGVVEGWSWAGLWQ